MKLPDDMFKQELVPYLIVDDISKLDSACMNLRYRPELLEMLHGVRIDPYIDPCMSASLYGWLVLRGIIVGQMTVTRLLQQLAPVMGMTTTITGIERGPSPRRSDCSAMNTRLRNQLNAILRLSNTDDPRIIEPFNVMTWNSQTMD